MSKSYDILSDADMRRFERDLRRDADSLIQDGVEDAIRNELRRRFPGQHIAVRSGRFGGYEAYVDGEPVDIQVNWP